MDDWGFEHLDGWLGQRLLLPVGPLSASLTARPAAERGRRPLCAANSERSRSRRVFAAALLPIS
jgi:hypothetical protein